MPRTYATPLAFKTGVEQRLRNEATAKGMDLQRRRQLFVFDRFLARLFHVLEDAVVLKGGLVIELRLERARTTKDTDLRASAKARCDSPLARQADTNSSHSDAGRRSRFFVMPPVYRRQREHAPRRSVRGLRRARRRAALHRPGLMSIEDDKRRLIEWLRAETARSLGRRYAVKFEALDVESLRELVRLVRDLDHEKQAVVNRARMIPWRR